jgi:hypothetical protein
MIQEKDILKSIGIIAEAIIQQQQQGQVSPDLVKELKDITGLIIEPWTEVLKEKLIDEAGKKEKPVCKHCGEDIEWDETYATWIHFGGSWKCMYPLTIAEPKESD